MILTRHFVLMNNTLYTKKLALTKCIVLIGKLALNQNNIDVFKRNLLLYHSKLKKRLIKIKTLSLD